MEFITLSNGVKMPALGYGTFTMSNEETERCVLEAIKTGYRLIDTAQAYYNEEGVGNAIIKCGVPREELFITTKIWIENAGYEKAKASLHESLKKLQIEYIDLVLIHQAFNDYYGTWKALEEAYKLGKVRAIGVSNFYLDRFMDLATFSEIKPMVNQLETHVFQQHKNDKKFLERYGTKLEAWAPFARGSQGIFENEVLMKIAKQHNKTIGQVALRFLIQNGIIAIPKSTHKNRMEENFNIFDFSLSDEEMKKIEELDLGENVFMNHENAEDIAVGNLTLDEIRHCIAGLKPQYGDYIRMRYVDELDDEVIAEFLSVKPSSLRMIAVRARRALCEACVKKGIEVNTHGRK